MARSARSSLTASDLQRALQFVRRQRAEAPTLPRFAYSASAGLGELIGADIVTLSYCDLHAGTRSVVTWPERAIGADDVASFNRHFHAHPLVRYHASHPAGGAWRISDEWPESRFRGSALFAEYYRRIGIDRVVAVPVHIDADRVISFVLNRASRDFSDRECALLDTLRFQLGAEYTAQEARLRSERTLAQLNEVLDGAGMAVVVLDQARRVRLASERALTWLAYAGLARDIAVGDRLPETIDRWMRARLAPSWATFDSGPLTLAAPVQTLRLHLLQGEDSLTLLLERVPGTNAPALKSEHGLTGREHEVLEWLAAGKSNAEIATILGMRPRTVHKHLERIFRKLGVENRTAAVLRALELDRPARGAGDLRC